MTRIHIFFYTIFVLLSVSTPSLCASWQVQVGWVAARGDEVGFPSIELKDNCLFIDPNDPQEPIKNLQICWNNQRPQKGCTVECVKVQQKNLNETTITVCQDFATTNPKFSICCEKEFRMIGNSNENKTCVFNERIVKCYCDSILA